LKLTQPASGCRNLRRQQEQSQRLLQAKAAMTSHLDPQFHTNLPFQTQTLSATLQPIKTQKPIKKIKKTKTKTKNDELEKETKKLEGSSIFNYRHFQERGEPQQGHRAKRFPNFYNTHKNSRTIHQI